MADKPRLITERLVKRGDAEKEFDRAFWREAGHEARFAAAWQMWWNPFFSRGKMQANSDFRDLLKMFSEESVEYLVVGAHAVIHYAEPRYTKDFDVWVNPHKTQRKFFVRFAALAHPWQESPKGTSPTPSLSIRWGFPQIGLMS